MTLCCSIGNFKNLLLWNEWSDYITHWNKWSSNDSLPKLLKLTQSVKKWGPAGDGHFVLCCSIENFKNLLLWNLWLDFIVNWYKWLSSDPLLKLLKWCLSIKKWGDTNAPCTFSTHVCCHLFTLQFKQNSCISEYPRDASSFIASGAIQVLLGLLLFYNHSCMCFSKIRLIK